MHVLDETDEPGLTKLETMLAVVGGLAALLAAVGTLI
jgi:hypothetical protein